MSVAPRVRSTTTSAEENEKRPVLVPAGNKTSLASPARKSVSKPLRKVEKLNSSPASVYSPPVSPSLKSQVASKRQDTLMHSNLSLNASCSSDCSMESFRSRASTGRIGSRASLSSRRKQGLPRPETILSKLEKIVPDGTVITPLQAFHRKRRCSWVTPTTDPCYAAFHDEEWGVPVHDDKKLFELLVFSGALAELTWPVILSKRQIFREVFLDFDPAAVSKLSEKKITAQGSLASSLLSEPKLRAVIENARQIVKLIEEFGSFDKYCWNFVNNKPIVSKFRYSRQVPVKTAKADVISKDMVRRGFRSVGPTVIYSFMQVSGITNDHLISCYRFEECCSPSTLDVDKKDESILPSNGKIEEDLSLIIPIDGTPISPRREGNLELEFAKVVEDLSFS